MKMGYTLQMAIGYHRGKSWWTTGFDPKKPPDGGQFYVSGKLFQGGSGLEQCLEAAS